MENKKNELRALLVAACLYAGVGVLALARGSQKDDLVPFPVLLEEYEDDTLIDDVFECEESQKIEKSLNDLYERIVLSEKLHSLDIKPQNYKETKIMKMDDIKTLISVSDDENRTEEEKQLLKYNEAIINNYIYENGYSILANTSKLIVKAKIIEALGIAAIDYQDISIDSNPNTNNFEEPTDITFTYDTKNNKQIKLVLDSMGILNDDSILAKLTNDIYKCQRLEHKKNSLKDELNLESYNHDRNDKLIEMMEDMNKILYSTYRVEDNHIIQNEDNSDIRKEYKKETKMYK